MILCGTLPIEQCKAYAMPVSGHREADHTEKIIGNSEAGSQIRWPSLENNMRKQYVC